MNYRILERPSTMGSFPLPSNPHDVLHRQPGAVDYARCIVLAETAVAKDRVKW